MNKKDFDFELPLPIFNNQVTQLTSEGTRIDIALKAWFDTPSGSFILVDPRTGLVLVSVTPSTTDNGFVISKSDGRFVTNLIRRRDRRQIAYSMPELGYIATKSSNSLTVCLKNIPLYVINDNSVIRRQPSSACGSNMDSLPADTVVAFLFNAINLIDNK
jgi:hypothetical protein